MEIGLPGGLVLRAAQPSDVAGAARLLAARGEPADAHDLELVIGTEGRAGLGVVVDDGQVVSTATLLDEVVHVGGIGVPAGQVELVATDPSYEGRGLVRALMGWAHARSRERGHLLQVMVGIPYFYRQFGYAYVTPIPPWQRMTEAPAAAGDHEVRPASRADIPAIDALQQRAQAAVDVRMGHSPSCWRWLVDREVGELWLAERAGTPVGVVRTAPTGDGGVATELAATDDLAALTLVAHAAAQAGGTLQLRPRPSTPAAVTGLLDPPVDPPEWYYARVEHLPSLLAHLAPLLARRLADAGLGQQEHEVLLSTWRRHLRFTIGPTGFRLLADGGAEQAPISKGGSGVPPDAIAPLLLGPSGALGLEERLPDCVLGRQRELMAALFPPLTADLLTFYVP